MAEVEAAPKQNSTWHNRRRPFSQWVKRLANLKGSSSDSNNNTNKKGSPSKSKKATRLKNNPYPESGYPQAHNKDANGHPSPFSPARHSAGSFGSIDEQGGTGDQRAPTISNKSAAPTVTTNPETVHSETGQSKAETSRSAGGGNSTFSSPNHSERSLTTTLTTIQSTAASGLLTTQNGGNVANAPQGSQNPVQFTHQFPVSPASAIPPHLAPHNVPQTYQAATANGVLTDNASILTLASSSKRRRRNSLDTNASVRALAPSSVWGGSRESLPLSVLSDRVDGATSTNQGPRPTTMTGFASAERASVYSSSGAVAPTLSSERNSYYASKQIDGASVRSGKLGHGRSESITGSIGGITPSSPLASPRDPFPLRISRRSSDWKRADSDTEEEQEEDTIIAKGDPKVQTS